MPQPLGPIALSSAAVRNPVATADLVTMAEALTTQIRDHAAPAYGAAFRPVVAYGSPSQVPADLDGITVYDDADQAGDLGYHLENGDGRALASLFYQPIKDAGGGLFSGPVSLSSVASHEALELWGDRTATVMVETPNGYLVARELCDPCESGSYVIQAANGTSVEVSDFVLPAWFDAAAQGPFSYLRATPAAFTVAPGGYMIQEVDGQVSQVFGSTRARGRDRFKVPRRLVTRRAATGLWLAPVGARLVDTSGVVTAAAVNALKAGGVQGVMLALRSPSSNRNPAPIPPASVALIRQGGLALNFYQTFPTLNQMSATQGTIDGQSAVQQIEALGPTNGVGCEGDFEIAAGITASAQQWMDYWNSFGAALIQGGCAAALYVGSNKLTPSQLGGLPNIHGYEKAAMLSINEPTPRGWQGYQLNPPDRIYGGVAFDVTCAQVDYRGGQMTFWAPLLLATLALCLRTLQPLRVRYRTKGRRLAAGCARHAGAIGRPGVVIVEREAPAGGAAVQVIVEVREAHVLAAAPALPVEPLLPFLVQGHGLSRAIRRVVSMQPSVAR